MLKENLKCSLVFNVGRRSVSPNRSPIFFAPKMRMILILTEAYKPVLSNEKLAVVASIRGVGFLLLKSILEKNKFDISLDLCIGKWN